ncbi:alpha/beta fold hydrolase [Marinobacter lacisalsi]|uniref:Alpha/beta fold hydrolase n=1 Tax=Marinobacter lacisalsi TaxID=475979 RepID=A0ABV8QEJ9_9GAMM
MENSANTAKTRWVDIDGANIAFRVLGQTGNKPPLVLCHRFRATMDEWDPALLDLLAEHRQVIVFDSAGVGASGGKTPASIAEMAAIASRFILSRADEVDVLGWSMGGMVALSLALEYPGLVRRVIVAGSTPGGIEGSRPAPARVWEVAGKPVNTDDDFLYLFFPDTEDGRAAGRAHLARLGQRTEAPLPPVNVASVGAQFQAIQTFAASSEVRSRLGHIRQPVFMANGVHDIMVHAYASYAAVEALPDGLCTIYPASGHGFLFQHHQRFARDVDSFLS